MAHRPDDLKRLVADGEIETVLAVFPDMYGRLVGKRIVGALLRRRGRRARHARVRLPAGLRHGHGSGARLPVHELGEGLRRLPAGPRLQHAARRVVAATRRRWCSATCTKRSATSSCRIAPRGILRKQLERAAELGFTAMGASELELYVFKDSYEDARRRASSTSSRSAASSRTTTSSRARRRSS